MPLTMIDDADLFTIGLACADGVSRPHDGHNCDDYGKDQLGTFAITALRAASRRFFAVAELVDTHITQIIWSDINTSLRCKFLLATMHTATLDSDTEFLFRSSLVWHAAPPSSVTPTTAFTDAALSKRLVGSDASREESENYFGIIAGAKVPGPMGAAVTLAVPLCDTVRSFYDLHQGDPTGSECDAVLDRILQLIATYRQEPPSHARDDIIVALGAATLSLDDLKSSVGYHHGISSGMRIGANCLSLASSACLAAGVFTMGATAVVGLGFAGGALATSASCDVAKSCKGYEFRNELISLTESVIGAQKQYAASTGRRSEGLTGQPGCFRFSVTESTWCQLYMTVAYTTHDGRFTQKLSCDQGRYSWYGDDIIIEPGARDVTVSFDVRGGGEVCAVDRSCDDFPWIEPYQREVFNFSTGDGVTANFIVAGGGTVMSAYVYAAHF